MVTHQVRIRHKGQMTLPAEVREELGLGEGDVVYLRKTDGAYTLSPAESWVERTRGALKTNHTPIEPDQLEELIEAAASADALEGFGKVE